MSEWLDPMNPFNSLKCLAWTERLARFYKADWADAPMPVTLDVELTNACNLKCPWCFTRDWREQEQGHMSDAAFWGTLAFAPHCAAVQITGGGEPTLHPKFDVFVKACVDRGIPFSLITNGTRLRCVNLDLLAKAAWVGVSVDAGTAETWSCVKGMPEAMFVELGQGIAELVARGVPVTYKFCVTRENAGDLEAAIKRASLLNCESFHARAAYGVDDPDVDRALRAVRRTYLSGIAEGGIASTLFDTRNMAIYIDGHKIRGGESPKRFRRCVETRLLLTVCADGNCYICQDHRGDEEFKLTNVESFSGGYCTHGGPWGGMHHRRLIAAIDPQKCGKCTMNAYNEAFEKLQPWFL